MSGLPALNQEDQDLFAQALDGFLSRSKALRALLLEQAGYVIRQAGRNPELHTESFAALASNAFNAIDALSKCLQEPDFKVLHQRGGIHQTGIFRIDESCLLAAIFPAEIPIEDIEKAAAESVSQIAEQLGKARLRLPNVSVDLADHNPESVDNFLFKRKPAE
jgi:predicted regulator of Ras-like GTPase activity (Roadblock/LC7/MglB family)